jgi:signal transduction histidine kinase
VVEVALADPERTIASLSHACRRVLAAGEQQERLIEALLTLARSQRGLGRRDPVELAAVTGDAVRSRLAEAGRRGLTVRADLSPAATLGDARLAERLAANLLDNAVAHNTPGGWVRVRTGIRAGHDGLGLGLSIVRAIADAHQATLRARALPDGGLDIQIRFPAIPAAACPVTEPPRRQAVAAGTR